MKLIKMSLAAAMLMGASAYALEDIKVSGEAKLWYETTDADTEQGLFDRVNSSGEGVLKVGVTAKQGNVSFGLTSYAGTSLGLEGEIVNGVRTNAVNGDAFMGEAYIAAPLLPDTIVKAGYQELDTPLAFTEKWNALPNTFNAAVLVNSSIPNTTLIGAYVGQSNSITNGAGSWRVNADGEMDQFHGGAYAVAALTKIATVPVNVWYYDINDVGGDVLDGIAGFGAAHAFWVDATIPAGPVSIGAIYANVDLDAAADATTAYALSVSGKVADVALSAAYSDVDEDGTLPVANTATGFKKTKLPTAGVYTDGLVVAQPGAQAWKVKASTKVAGWKVTAQYINNENDTMGFNAAAADATEADLIVAGKLGDLNTKVYLMNKTFENITNVQDSTVHVRAIVGYNF